MIRKTILSLLLLLTSTHIFASNYETIERLYQQGEFLKSAQLARELNTAQGYSLAAKATLVEASYIANSFDKLELFEQAIVDAKQALHINANYLDAHLQIAMAIGFIADHKNSLTAYIEGYAEEGKYHLDKAMELDPENAWVNGLRGIWHLQIVRRGTSIIAENLYNASVDKGLYYCDKAEQLSTDELHVLYGCAVSMYYLDKEHYKEKSCKLLEMVANQRAKDIADIHVIQQAKIELSEKFSKSEYISLKHFN